MSSRLPSDAGGSSNQPGGPANGGPSNGGPPHQPSNSAGSGALPHDSGNASNGLSSQAKQQLLGLAREMSGVVPTAAALRANVQRVLEGHAARQANKRVTPLPSEPSTQALKTMLASWEESEPEAEPATKKRKLDGVGVDMTYNRQGRFDLITSLASCHELTVEVCKHLPHKEMVSLYSISKPFKETFDAYTLSTVLQIARFAAPEALKLYPWTLYKNSCKRDPMRRPTDPLGKGKAPVWPPSQYAHSAMYDQVPPPPNTMQAVHRIPRIQPVQSSVDIDDGTRLVPGLRYLGMLLERERMVRDILAALARSGHRMPKSMNSTLKKMWLLMDLPHNEGRHLVISSASFFTDTDLYNMHMFAIKLVMRFNDPLRDVTDSLSSLLLGQKSGLYPLWCLLRAKRGGASLRKIVDMKIRYDYEPTEQEFYSGADIFGVPLHQVGFGHTEGWGRGYYHLLRPDELATIEAARRRLHLDAHVTFMMTWGFHNFYEGKNMVPSRDEMYMSDPELPPVKGPSKWKSFGNVPFHDDEWQPHHEFKARWEQLTVMEKLLVWQEQREERLLHSGWQVHLEIDDEHDGFVCPEWYEPPRRVEDEEWPPASPQWNAVNKPKVPPPSEALQEVAPLQAAAPPFGQILGARDREIAECVFDQMAQPALDEQDGLKRQARESYSIGDMEAWDHYLESLSDGFWAGSQSGHGGQGSDGGTASAMDVDDLPAPAFAPANPAYGPMGPILAPTRALLEAVDAYELGSDSSDDEGNRVADRDLLDHQVLRLMEHLRFLGVDPLRPPPPETQPGESDEIVRMRRDLERKMTKAVFAYDFRRFATRVD